MQPGGGIIYGSLIVSAQSESLLLGCNIILETLRTPLEFLILVYWKTTSINNVLSISICHLLPTIRQRLNALHSELQLLRVEEAGQLRFNLSKVNEPLST